MTELQTAFEKGMSEDDINLFFKPLYEATVFIVRVRDDEAGDQPIFLSEGFDEDAPPYITVAESRAAIGELAESEDLVFSEISGAQVLNMAARHGLEVVVQFEDENLYCVDRDHIEFWQEENPEAFELEPQTEIPEEFIVGVDEDDEDDEEGDEE